MRIRPNHSRLRSVAFGCWAIAALCLTQGGMISIQAPTLLALTLSIRLLGILLLAVGVAFWLLGNDQQAGITFDTKGLLLNLGNSTSFIAWENIERVGVSSHRSQLLAIGSRQQFGIALRNQAVYIQSYEERLPATPGVFARALRGLASLLRPFRQANDRPLTTQIEQNRAKSGYDILIPEAFLGGQAKSFASLVETYRTDALGRRRLNV